MSSTIVHVAAKPGEPATSAPAESSADASDATREGRHALLVALGQRLKTLRLRRGLTRKALAAAADVSERHLANLEYGVGNASILVLHQVAEALHAPLAELLGDPTTASPEWMLIRELLVGRDEAALRQVRVAIGELFGGGARGTGGIGSPRIALVGLRGAGKSTLGARLAADLGVPFIELTREIEALAGCPSAEIQALYGQSAYRRYERRAAEEALERHAACVLATPGGVVADAATFNLLLGRCTTVWLRATPEDHMRRVVEQGDLRPMADNREAMQDLRSILDGRAPFYAKADLIVDTSAQPLDATARLLCERVRRALGWPEAGQPRPFPAEMHSIA